MDSSFFFSMQFSPRVSLHCSVDFPRGVWIKHAERYEMYGEQIY